MIFYYYDEHLQVVIVWFVLMLASENEPGFRRLKIRVHYMKKLFEKFEGKLQLLFFDILNVSL